jgi:S-formylglutathione hydrolase
MRLPILPARYNWAMRRLPGAQQAALWGFALLLILASGLAGLSFGQAQAGPHGTVERIKVHGKSIEGNLEGDSPDRDVSVYLPPSYKAARNRRYPVIYLLHGFTDDDDHWFGRIKHFVNVPEVLDKAMAGGARHEMIVVMPNAFTAYQGSMYSNSVTTGDWETFIAADLVSFIDGHYRTIPDRMSRGLAGHSMGGYGTLRIGMKRPDVFSSIYALSPCCLPANSTPQNLANLEKIQTVSEIAKADFGTKAAFASAAAWSPNPGKPPFFLDLPSLNGQLQPDVIARWSANAPLAMVDQYIPSLKRLHAIAFDAGDKDKGIADSIRVLDQILSSYNITHAFEIYPGDHISGVAERLGNQTLQFFADNLSFSKSRR